MGGVWGERVDHEPIEALNRPHSYSLLQEYMYVRAIGLVRRPSTLGQLGIGDRKSYATPRKVKLPEDHTPSTVCCGPDCSIVITSSGQVLASGQNKYVGVVRSLEQSTNSHVTLTSTDVIMLHRCSELVP